MSKPETMMIDDVKYVREDSITELPPRGGEWLAEARGWIQRKIQGGDRLTWGSNQPVTVAFCDLEDFAKTVAVAAIAEERKRVKIRIDAINTRLERGSALSDLLIEK